jgi:hypothetical protein
LQKDASRAAEEEVVEEAGRNSDETKKMDYEEGMDISSR